MINRMYSTTMNSKIKIRGYTIQKFFFWLVILVLFLLPLERIIFPLSLKAVDLILVPLIGLGGLYFFRESRRFQVPLALPTWLIMIASLMATISIPTFDSLLAIIQEVYLFIWFVALTNILTTFKPSNFDMLITIWSIIAVFEAATSLMGMLKIGPAIFYTSPIKDNTLSTGAFNRGFGTFANPNATAAYLAISFFILQAAIWPKWLRIVFGSFIYMGIYSTGSMGAILSTTIGIITLVIFTSILNNRSRLLLYGGGVSIVIVFAILMFFLSQSKGPFFSLSEITSVGKENQILALTLGRLNHSVSGRVTHYDDAWQAFEKNPLGSGPNISDSHNDYIAYLFDRGLLGFFGWLGLVITTLLTPLSSIKQSQNNFRLKQILALWAGFLVVSIDAFTHEISHFRQVWVLMAFLYAAYYRFASTDNKSINTNVVKSQKAEIY